MKTITICMLFLAVLISVSFAQPNLDQEAAKEPVQVAQLTESRAASSATDCINPATGRPDQIVQCLVDPCLGFVPETPFETCTANYCGGCHAILCGVVVSGASSSATR